MAVMTSSLMLISQNINDQHRNLKVIVCRKFYFVNSNRFWLKTNLKCLLFSSFPKFDRYFNGRFWSIALNMHIFLLSGSKLVRFDILFLNSRNFRLQRFFQPSFWPEVDNVESWITIPDWAIRCSTLIHILKKIGSNLWPWQRYHFFNKYGGRNVINYVN